MSLDEEIEIKNQRDAAFRSLRSRHFEGLHAALRAKLARAQHVLWIDPEGYQRGESLSRLNAAVSAFLKEVPFAPSRRGQYRDEGGGGGCMAG